MRCCGLFLVLFILSSCGHVSPIQEATQDAQNSIVELENGLSEQCKNAETNARINAIKTKINNIEVKCSSKIEVLESEKIKWKTAFFALATIVAAWVAKRIIK